MELDATATPCFSQEAGPTFGSPAVPDSGSEFLRVRAVDAGSSTEPAHSGQVAAHLHIPGAVGKQDGK